MEISQGQGLPDRAPELPGACFSQTGRGILSKGLYDRARGACDTRGRPGPRR